MLTDLLGSIDDSGVIPELQRADDSGAQREQKVARDLLLLQGEQIESVRGGEKTPQHHNVSVEINSRHRGQKTNKKKTQGDWMNFIIGPIRNIVLPRPDRPDSDFML